MGALLFAPILRRYNRSMQIFLARHGQSRWQVSRVDGDWDSPLTELGQKQAQHLGQWAASADGIQFQHIRVSPLQRARQTAAPLAEVLAQPVTLDPNLREAEFLVSDHLPSSTDPLSPYQIPELSPTYNEFKEQVAAGWAALVADASAAGGPVLGVAHGGFIATLLRHIVGSDWVSFWIYNASLQQLEWKRGRWHLITLNQWDHLPPPLRTF